MTNKGIEELTDSEMKEIFKKAKNIAVVGLSSKTDRPSYGVAEYLQKKGYKIYPVNPSESEVLGEKAYPDLKSLPVIPDIVDIFRKTDTVLAVVDEAIEVGAKFLWFQLGVANLTSLEKAKNSDITTVFDKCIMVEHRNLGL